MSGSNRRTSDSATTINLLDFKKVVYNRIGQYTLTRSDNDAPDSVALLGQSAGFEFSAKRFRKFSAKSNKSSFATAV
jgi:hypothetical protein